MQRKIYTSKTFESNIFCKPNILNSFGNKFLKTENSITNFERKKIWNKVLNTKFWKQISREKATNIN